MDDKKTIEIGTGMISRYPVPVKPIEIDQIIRDGILEYHTKRRCLTTLPNPCRNLKNSDLPSRGRERAPYPFTE